MILRCSATSLYPIGRACIEQLPQQHCTHDPLFFPHRPFSCTRTHLFRSRTYSCLYLHLHLSLLISLSLLFLTHTLYTHFFPLLVDRRYTSTRVCVRAREEEAHARCPAYIYIHTCTCIYSRIRAHTGLRLLLLRLLWRERAENRNPAPSVSRVPRLGAVARSLSYSLSRSSAETTQSSPFTLPSSLPPLLKHTSFLPRVQL